MNQPATVSEQFDAVAVGAGFSGLYMLDRLRRLGMSVRVFDSADDVGGTWYWNRYLGARCDIPTTDYAYSFDPELERDWTWPEKYATQPEILDYLRFVADRHGLRSDIEFSTAVVAARWEEEEQRWTITTGRGTQIRCRYYIMASGCQQVLPAHAELLHPGAQRRGTPAPRAVVMTPWRRVFRAARTGGARGDASTSRCCTSALTKSRTIEP